MDLLRLIKQYEEKIFHEYCQKRQVLHGSLQTLQCNELTNTQLENMVCDIKQITSNLIETTNSIDCFLENQKKDFTSTQSIDDITFRLKMCLLYTLISDSDSVSVSVSESVSESVSLSDSESSSRSDSLTFSS